MSCRPGLRWPLELGVSSLRAANEKSTPAPFPLRVLTDLPARPEGQDRGREGVAGRGAAGTGCPFPHRALCAHHPPAPSSLSAPASEVTSVTRATGKVGRVMKVGVWPLREVRHG